MEDRDDRGRFVAGHPGQKPSGTKSELQKKYWNLSNKDGMTFLHGLMV